MTIDVATGIARVRRQEGVDWISTFPVCRVNNALGREGMPMLMLRDDRSAAAVADAFSRITAGTRIGLCAFQGGVNAAGMQYAYACLPQAYEEGSPVLSDPAAIRAAVALLLQARIALIYAEEGVNYAGASGRWVGRSSE
jgi:thiamine pyrophosphate-dependent acetolactate synthase large subunit-like protein